MLMITGISCVGGLQTHPQKAKKKKFTAVHLPDLGKLCGALQFSHFIREASDVADISVSSSKFHENTRL